MGMEDANYVGLEGGEGSSGVYLLSEVMGVRGAGEGASMN